MPLAKPITPNSAGTASAGTEPRPMHSATRAATPKPAPTTRSQRAGSAARKPPTTMPPALHTM